MGCGQVHDVPGYEGSRVVIYCFFPQPGVYFCKYTTQSICKNLIEPEAQEKNKWINKEKASLLDSRGSFALVFRNLSLQDAGMYQCGENGVWSHEINLQVNSGENILLLLYTFLRYCLGSNLVFNS